MPFTRLEIAMLGVSAEGLQVLLARRAGPPYKGRWALPGGVLRVDLDASLDAAVGRVGRERLGLELPFLRQLCCVGGPRRDPRAPWALSVVYRGLVPIEALALQSGKRIEALKWEPADAAMGDTALAFDHATLIRRAVEDTRAAVADLDLPFEALPEMFTLGELQSWCECVLGERLDKSSFRRRLADRDLVEPVQGQMRGGAFRPAQLYCARKTPSSAKGEVRAVTTRRRSMSGETS